MTDISELSHEDQVSLWAGRVVRKEAEIESTLRTIYYWLSGQGLSWAVVPEMFAKVSKDVRNMLKASAIDPEYVSDCLAALDRLDKAHVVRNRVVHDQWVQQNPGTFLSAQKGVGGPNSKPEVRWNVAEFEQCFAELQFCGVQIGGIFWSLPCYVGDNRDMWRDLLPMNREILAGRFKITSDNTQEFTDPVFNAQERRRMEERSEAMRIDVQRALGLSGIPYQSDNER